MAHRPDLRSRLLAPQATVEWTEAAVAETDEQITSLFARNLVQFRAECRVGLAVRRPRGVVKITLPTEE